MDKRWPEIEQSTELGENINKVFTIRAQEGESLRQWCARAGECFDSCSRKSGVKFPEEAKGWILLNCGGLTSEQRAVILARAQGDLRFDEVPGLLMVTSTMWRSFCQSMDLALVRMIPGTPLR